MVSLNSFICSRNIFEIYYVDASTSFWASVSLPVKWDLTRLMRGTAPWLTLSTSGSFPLLTLLPPKHVQPWSPASSQHLLNSPQKQWKHCPQMVGLRDVTWTTSSFASILFKIQGASPATRLPRHKNCLRSPVPHSACLPNHLDTSRGPGSTCQRIRPSFLQS